GPVITTTGTAPNGNGGINPGNIKTGPVVVNNNPTGNAGPGKINTPVNTGPVKVNTPTNTGINGGNINPDRVINRVQTQQNFTPGGQQQRFTPQVQRSASIRSFSSGSSFRSFSGGGGGGGGGRRR